MDLASISLGSAPHHPPLGPLTWLLEWVALTSLLSSVSSQAPSVIKVHASNIPQAEAVRADKWGNNGQIKSGDFQGQITHTAGSLLSSVPRIPDMFAASSLSVPAELHRGNEHLGTSEHSLLKGPTPWALSSPPA